MGGQNFISPPPFLHLYTHSHLVVDLQPAALTTSKEKTNKLIINQDVLLRTSITQVRRHIDDKRTVQRKLSMFLVKKTSPTSTEEHDPDMYCTVSLSKRYKTLLYLK
jgi:hypothetical protein